MDIEPQDFLQNLGEIQICEIVKTSQSQNGLKHQDYQRYRNYCGNRVKRIQKQMKFTFEKKFKKKDITSVCKNDPRMPLVLLYGTERAWAHAMEMKQKLALGTINRRAKYHIQKRFAKASKIAALLHQNLINRTEKKSEFEAEAYSEYMNGCYDFEKENWDSALGHYVKSFFLIKGRHIYQEIQKISTHTQSYLFQEKTEMIDQSIRFCNHKLQKGLTYMSVEEILLLKSKTLDPSFKELMQKQFKSHLEANHLAEIMFQGEKLLIKNVQVLEAQQNISNIKEQIQKVKGSQTSDIESLLSLYVELFSYFDEAIRSTQKEFEVATEVAKVVLQKILLYFEQAKAEHLLDRNTLQLTKAIQQFEAENGFDNLNNLKNRKQKLVTPWEIIRWSDNVISAQNALQNTINSDQQLYARCIRGLFVVCLYFQHSKYMESYSLSHHILQQMGLKSSNEWSKLRADFAKLMRKNIVALQVEQQQETYQLNKSMETLNIHNIQSNKTLQELMEQDNMENPEKICEFLPKLSVIGSKPMFYDIGLQNLKFPDLTAKCQKKGLFGKALSFFGKK